MLPNGPCYDLLAPPVAWVNGALPEHLYWDAVPEEGLTALAGSDGASQEKAQAHAAQKAVYSLQTHLAAIEASVGFSRTGAFAVANGSSMAIIGGERPATVHTTLASVQDESSKGSNTADVQAANIEARLGRAPKRPRANATDTQGGAKKKKQMKSEQTWEQLQSMELDQSSIADLCRAQECSSNIIISDVCERLRSGRMRIETSPARHCLSKRHDTAAQCGDMLVVFSSWQGSISVFVLDSKPPSPQEDPLRTPLAWGSCAMPETRMDQVVSTSQKSSEGLKSPGPANNSQQHENASPNAAAATAAAANVPLPATEGSRIWQQRDIQQSGEPELGSASLLSTVCTVSRAPGEISTPQSCDSWSSLCADVSRNRLLVLQCGKGDSLWQLFAMEPCKPCKRAADVSLRKALLCRHRFQTRHIQGLKGRPISARYSVLHTAVHNNMLFAVVCPDGSTAANQRPCALRVYTLDLTTTLATTSTAAGGAWQLISPNASDSVACKYPLPRNQAACTDQGSKVYIHGGVSVATGHGCINDLWTFDMATCMWTQLTVATVCASATTKLASTRVTAVAACQHTLAIDGAGTLLVFGGNVKGAELNRKMQALLPLVSNVPGGLPTNLPAVTRVRLAGTLAALAFCRSHVARAVMKAGKSTAVITATTSDGGKQRILAPVRVLALYSAMLHNMMQDGVIGEEDEESQGAPVLPANPRHDAHSVEAALRWTMGLSTMLSLDVHRCSGVLRVAEFFEMRSLRMECICVIGKKATADHVPLLTDLCTSMTISELAPVLNKLRLAARI